MASFTAPVRVVHPRVRRSRDERQRADPPPRWAASALAGLSAAQREPIERFARGPAQRPSHACIHHAIEHWAQRHPDAIAAEHLDQRMSYLELEQRANRLAAALRQVGVGPGRCVGLYVQRSLAMVVGMLAVLKTGAAYVPQCVGIAPAAQLAYVAAQAGLDVVLTQRSLRGLLPPLPGRCVIDIDSVMDAASACAGTAPSFRPARAARGSDPCFVLFTSGTTGQPNGAVVTHDNVCNIVLTSPGDLGLQPGMRVAQFLNIGFDMAAWEILGALSHGATLVLRGADFQAVAETVHAIIATPSILASLDATRCHQVQVVAVAGEPCPRALADTWAAFCCFYNGCGPTEVTIVNTMQRHHPQARLLTIGKPTPNNTVYVLDEQMRPCAIGEIGEMWAGGDCVSLGYIGNPALTAERYHPDPYLGGGRSMFRTRDLARWTPEGELEHLGRVDDQVKVRGFRVELDAISSVLERTPGCEQAVTLKLNDRDLVAFVRPACTDREAARAQLRATLPYYCVPAQTFPLDSFPLTPRGKIDKPALLRVAQRLMSDRAGGAAPGGAE